jgi:hypothetical protein
MTPSLVGYLCPECGNMQRFYTATSISQPLQTDLPAAPGPKNSSTDVAVPAAETPEQKKIRSTLKRLMVPELSPPHHEQLLNETSDSQVSHVMTDQSPLKDFAASSGPNMQAGQMPVQPQNAKHKTKTWVWVVLALFVFSIVALVITFLMVPRTT